MANKNKKDSTTDRDGIVFETRNLSLQTPIPVTCHMELQPGLPIRSATEPRMPTYRPDAHPPSEPYGTYTSSDDSIYPQSTQPDASFCPACTYSNISPDAAYPAINPLPYSTSPFSSTSSLTTGTLAVSDSPGPKKPSKALKRIQSLKQTVEDGRATSFAKAAYSGGREAQSTFLEAGMVTPAATAATAGIASVAPGAIPVIGVSIVAFNTARAVYKGGKEARKAWKEAEEERIERLVREGKMDENGNMICVEIEEDYGLKETVVGVSKKEEKALAKARAEEDKASAKGRPKKRRP